MGYVEFSATGGGLALFGESVTYPRMFEDADSFLARVLEKAGTKAEMGRALDLPSSRIAEFFREEGNNKRRLSMEEGVRLSRYFDLPIDEYVSEETLKAILTVVLRHAPARDGWSDRDVDRLVRAIAHGVRLRQRLAQPHPSPDALTVVGESAAGLFRDMRPEEDTSS